MCACRCAAGAAAIAGAAPSAWSIRLAAVAGACVGREVAVSSVEAATCRERDTSSIARRVREGEGSGGDRRV